MEQSLSTSEDKTVLGVSVRTLAIAGGVVAALGLGYVGYKLFFARPGFIDYEPSSEPGSMRMMAYLTEVRVPVLGACFDDKLWAKMLAKANESDDYDKYVKLLQDLLMFNLLTDNITGITSCVEALGEVIQPRVFKNGLKGGYDVDAPELIDYIKWACIASIFYTQAGQDAKSRDLLETLLEIDYAIAAKRKQSLTATPPTTNEHLPRVMYGAQQYVVSQFEAHNRALQSGNTSSPIDTAALADIMLKAREYMDTYLPSEITKHSQDELRHELGLYGSLAEYYDTINDKDMCMDALHKILVILRCLGHLQSPDAFFTRKRLANIYLGKGQIASALEQLEMCVDDLLEVCKDFSDTTQVREELELLDMLFDTYFGLHYVASANSMPSSERIIVKINAISLRDRYPVLYDAFTAQLAAGQQ